MFHELVFFTTSNRNRLRKMFTRKEGRGGRKEEEERGRGNEKERKEGREEKKRKERTCWLGIEKLIDIVSDKTCTGIVQ